MFTELSPKEVYHALTENKNSLLIDCRTRAEWVYVGIPDIRETKGQLALIEWSDITGQQNLNFVNQCQEQASADTEIFVICRSGVRSAAACMSLVQNGFEKVCNVREGFEGDLDSQNHRSLTNGWKYHQLPWHQR
jgi:rhodanese-related sulfurtransferase